MAITKGPKNEKTTASTGHALKAAKRNEHNTPAPILQPGESHEHFMARFHAWYQSGGEVLAEDGEGRGEAKLLEEDEKRSGTEGAADSGKEK